VKRLRFWLSGALLWFFVFYNVERLGQPVNIASFVYVYTVACAVLIIIFPWLNKTRSFWPFLLAFLPYYYIKIRLGYGIGGENLPNTVLEICAIGLTILLSRQIGRELFDFNEAVDELTVGQLNKSNYPFEIGQGQIYREVRRARNYQRPAALLAISVTEDSLNLSLNRFIQEAQRDMIKKFIAAHTANLIVGELKDSDVVVQRDDHFVALLPEASRDNVREVVERLEAAGREKLGLTFKIGISTFPDEAVTFERLLEIAEAQMQNQALPTESHVEPASTNTQGVLQT